MARAQPAARQLLGMSLQRMYRRTGQTPEVDTPAGFEGQRS